MFFKLKYRAFKTTPVIPPFLDKKDIAAIRVVAFFQSCKTPKYDEVIPFSGQEQITIYRGICPEELAAYKEKGPAALGIWWTRQKEKAKGYADANNGVMLQASIKGGDIILYQELDEIRTNGDEIRIIPEDIPGFAPKVFPFTES